MFERATRECRMSPTIVTVSPSMRPFSWRTVKQSSSAWVGCSWAPSPGVDHRRLEHVGDPLGHARDGVAHHHGVGVHGVQGLRGVEDALGLREARRRRREVHHVGREALARDLEARRVRVDGSKKRLTIVRPRSVGTFLTSRCPISCMCSAVSRIRSICLAIEVLDPQQVPPDHPTPALPDSVAARRSPVPRRPASRTHDPRARPRRPRPPRRSFTTLGSSGCVGTFLPT